MKQTRLGDGTLLKKLDLCRLTGVPQQCLELLASALQSSTDFLRPLITGPPLSPNRGFDTNLERDQDWSLKTLPMLFAAFVEDADKCFWIDVTTEDREIQRP